jgi:hypothetical protein
LACALTVSITTPGLRAQVKASEGASKVPAPKPPPPPRGNAKNPKAPKLPPPDPVEQLKRFQQLTPEQREKELAKLPPKRRENVEKQLARFDAMTPVQRDRAMHRLELMQTLTPERKQAVNEAIKGLHERFDSLPPPERRQALAKELYADDMKQKWSPTELELLHGAFPNI